MIFECPECAVETDIENMPDRACDDMEWECPHCGYTTIVGWIAEVEGRYLSIIRNHALNLDCVICVPVKYQNKEQPVGMLQQRNQSFPDFHYMLVH